MALQELKGVKVEVGRGQVDDSQRRRFLGVDYGNYDSTGRTTVDMTPQLLCSTRDYGSSCCRCRVDLAQKRIRAGNGVGTGVTWLARYPIGVDVLGIEAAAAVLRIHGRRIG